MIGFFKDDAGGDYFMLVNLTHGADTIAEQATLHFRRVPAELQCNTCSARYQPTDEELICPNCHGIGATIVSGEEFFLESIDVE